MPLERECLGTDGMGFWPFSSGPNEDVVRAIQEYPGHARFIEAIDGAVKYQTDKARELAAKSGGVTPPEVMDALRRTNAAAVQARVRFYAMRDQLVSAVAEARRRGTLKPQDVTLMHDVGLAGLGLRRAAKRAARIVLKAKGKPPARKASAFRKANRIAVAAARRAVRAARVKGRGLRGLGIVPLVIIGYVLASAIAVAIVGGSFYTIYSAFGKSRAEAEAYSQQSDAALKAWQRQVDSMLAPTDTPGVGRPPPEAAMVPGSRIVSRGDGGPGWLTRVLSHLPGAAAVGPAAAVARVPGPLMLPPLPGLPGAASKSDAGKQVLEGAIGLAIVAGLGWGVLHAVKKHRKVNANGKAQKSAA